VNDELACTVWILDVNTRTWEEIETSGEEPTGCFGHCAALDATRGRVLAAGGRGPVHAEPGDVGVGAAR
jgi:hypothetical protein